MAPFDKPHTFLFLLATDDIRQLITLTVHLSVQHLICDGRHAVAKLF